METKFENGYFSKKKKKKKKFENGQKVEYSEQKMPSTSL